MQIALSYENILFALLSFADQALIGFPNFIMQNFPFRQSSRMATARLVNKQLEHNLLSCSASFCPAPVCLTSFCPAPLCLTSFCPAPLCLTSFCPAPLCFTSFCPVSIYMSAAFFCSSASFYPASSCPASFCPASFCPAYCCPAYEHTPVPHPSSSSSIMSFIHSFPHLSQINRYCFVGIYPVLHASCLASILSCLKKVAFILSCFYLVLPLSCLASILSCLILSGLL